MYVVLTLAELELFAGWSWGWNEMHDTGIDEVVGLDPRSFDPDETNIPKEVHDAYEIILDEGQARRMGILAPRGEYWLGRAMNAGFFSKPFPIARQPKKVPRSPEPEVAPAAGDAFDPGPSTSDVDPPRSV